MAACNANGQPQLYDGRREVIDICAGIFCILIFDFIYEIIIDV